MGKGEGGMKMDSGMGDWKLKRKGTKMGHISIICNVMFFAYN